MWFLSAFIWGLDSILAGFIPFLPLVIVAAVVAGFSLYAGLMENA